MADKDLLANIGQSGNLTWKRVAVIGGSGGLFIGASDYWVDQWFVDETDTKQQARMRALSQAAIGIGLAYLVKRWNKDVALGVAVGGVVGAGVRLWDSEEHGVEDGGLVRRRGRDAARRRAAAPGRRARVPRGRAHRVHGTASGAYARRRMIAGE